MDENEKMQEWIREAENKARKKARNAWIFAGAFWAMSAVLSMVATVLLIQTGEGSPMVMCEVARICIQTAGAVWSIRNAGELGGDAGWR